MLSEGDVLSFSKKKNTFIKKSVEESKKCQKRYHKKSHLRKFFKYVSVQYTIALFWNLALVLALHCHRGDNVKCGLLSKHLFQVHLKRTICRLKKSHNNEKINNF